METKKAVVSVAVSAGDVLCPVPGEQDTVTRAVSAALFAGTKPVGVAASAAVAGAIVEYYGGTAAVPAETTGLGTGLPAAVVVDESGRCVRRTPVADGDFVVGACDAAGVLTVRVTHTFANVLDFGAKGDALADDSAAIEAALGSLTGGTVYFPAGIYRTSRPIYLGGAGGVELRGENEFVSGIRFTLGYGPAICVSPAAGGHLPTGDALLSGPGRAAVLDAASNRTVNLRDTAVVDLDGATAFSIECTVLPEQVKGTTVVLSSSGRRLPGDPVSSAFAIYLVEVAGGYAVSATVRLGSEDLTVRYDGPVPLGQARYLGLVWDGTTLSLYVGAPGSTIDPVTAKPKSPANNTLTQALEESVLLGLYSAGNWPDFFPTRRSFTGRIDSIRISGHATHTGGGFVAPTAKFPTDDAGNRRRTRLLINFDRDVDVFTVGYTWHERDNAGRVYLMHHLDGQPGWCAATIRNLTVQSFGIGVQAQIAAGSVLDHVRVNYALDGVRLSNFSYETSIEQLTAMVTRIGLGVAHSGMVDVKRYHAGAQYEFTATGLVGVFARDWFIGMGHRSVVPILLTATQGGSHFHGVNITITDEDVRWAADQPQVRQAGVLTASLSRFVLETSVISTVFVDKRPCPPVIIHQSVLGATAIEGDSTFVSCYFVPSPLAAANIVFTGTLARHPVRMIGNENAVPATPWTESRHERLASFLGGCLSSTDTGVTQWQGTRDWVFAVDETTGQPRARQREWQATSTATAGPVTLLTVPMSTGTTRYRADVLATGPTGQSAHWTVERSFTGTEPWGDTRVVDSAGTGGGTVPAGWLSPAINHANGNITLEATAPTATTIAFAATLHMLESTL